MGKLSDKEKIKRKNKKELKSLMNKMSGDNLIWFKSLGKTRQFDFLFEWKREKYFNTLKQTEISEQTERKINFVGGIPTYTYVKKKVKSYPPSLKHFIQKSRKRFKYRISKEVARSITLGMLLEDIKNDERD